MTTRTARTPVTVPTVTRGCGSPARTVHTAERARAAAQGVGAPSFHRACHENFRLSLSAVTLGARFFFIYSRTLVVAHSLRALGESRSRASPSAEPARRGTTARAVVRPLKRLF